MNYTHVRVSRRAGLALAVWRLTAPIQGGRANWTLDPLPQLEPQTSFADGHHRRARCSKVICGADPPAPSPEMLLSIQMPRLWSTGNIPCRHRCVCRRSHSRRAGAYCLPVDAAAAELESTE
jgi:hypothetical protein